MEPPPKPILCGFTKEVHRSAAMAPSTAEPPCCKMSLQESETVGHFTVMAVVATIFTHLYWWGTWTNGTTVATPHLSHYFTSRSCKSYCDRPELFINRARARVCQSDLRAETRLYCEASCTDVGHADWQRRFWWHAIWPGQRFHVGSIWCPHMCAQNTCQICSADRAGQHAVTCRKNIWFTLTDMPGLSRIPQKSRFHPFEKRPWMT